MTVGLVILASIFMVSGVAHLARPDLYRPIMPGWLPAHDALIFISGVAEALLWLRLPLQAVMIWWTWKARAALLIGGSFEARRS